MNIRYLSTNDFHRINHLASISYPPEYYESDESFASKFKAYPNGCVAIDDNILIAYLVSYQYYGPIPHLDTNYNLPSIKEYYWIHDMCIDPNYRKKGIGSSLLEHCYNNCKSLNINILKLASVNNALSFWLKHGFKIIHYDGYYKCNIMEKLICP